MNKAQASLFACLFLLPLSTVNPPTTFAAGVDSEKADDAVSLKEVVVTAPHMTSPLTVETDPKKPRQPVPAADGSGYLKSIPGFSVVRKGGTAGDPLFRGLGGTRLNVLLDGGYLLGGCPNRMDPPTAYVFPESYSAITVLKGPESVLYGGGNIAGTVLFERNTEPFSSPGIRVNSSLLFGSFGRKDQLYDMTAGDQKAYVRFIKSQSESGDYTDGSGKKVHSDYMRDNITGIIGFTPNKDTLYEFSVDESEAHANYADRTMDGKQFDRTSYNFKFEKKNISRVISNIKFNYYHTYIDHVMDNYSYRPLLSSPMSMEVARTTTGGRLAADLNLSSSTHATVGFDYQKNAHSGNMVMGSKDYSAVSLTPDMTFLNYGIFAELKYQINNNTRLLGGLRFDDLDVTYAKYPGKTDTDKTHGAFLRYEHDQGKLTSYVGIGQAERPADWWERKKTGGLAVQPERNNQLDTGLLYHSGKLRTNLSLFYSKIDNFILVTNAGSNVKNINAVLYGGEADLTYSLTDRWAATAALAYTHGTDDSNDTPLPQIPPLEGTLGLKYSDKKWETGLLWRLVKAQNRYSVGNGTEIGTDIGPSAGFGTLSVNLAYRANKNWVFAIGIDNIFNKNYAEFVSRNGAAISNLGIAPTIRVNEPGRNIWLKANYSF